ncbi:MAG: alpha/beta fold hydrolase [Thiolinea sp.]
MNTHEALIFLPGMMCDARLFMPQISHISASHTIQVATLTRHDTMQALAEEVLANAPPIFALAGLSMGGIVAMEIMRIAPQRVSRLALLDTNPKAELPEVTERRWPQIEKVKAGQLRAVMRDEMKPNYLSDGAHQGAILDTCMAMAESLGPEVFIRQSLALMNRPDQQDTLRKVEIPTLILCGENDSLCPLERHELMQQLIANSQLTLIPGAGHLPTLEQPELTNEALMQWLKQ